MGVRRAGVSGMLCGMTPRRLVEAGIALLVLGIAVAWIGTSTALDAIGITLGGIGAVVLISAAFYAVGLSEDRERDRTRGVDHLD